jgi:diadenosine tetraphosphate (Ap4A) HIT family hydrolase
MTTLIHERVELARLGRNPTVICRMPSGWAVLADTQFLRGYTILLADPVVGDLNALDEAARSRFLLDMSLIGDALMEVTGSYRINYFILGNSDPALHAHILPRYLDEPDEVRKGMPFDYYTRGKDPITFDPLRDKELLEKLAAVIQKHL